MRFLKEPNKRVKDDNDEMSFLNKVKFYLTPGQIEYVRNCTNIRQVKNFSADERTKRYMINLYNALEFRDDVYDSAPSKYEELVALNDKIEPLENELIRIGKEIENEAQKYKPSEVTYQSHYSDDVDAYDNLYDLTRKFRDVISELKPLHQELKQKCDVDAMLMYPFDKVVGVDTIMTEELRNLEELQDIEYDRENRAKKLNYFQVVGDSLKIGGKMKRVKDGGGFNTSFDYELEKAIDNINALEKIVDNTENMVRDTMYDFWSWHNQIEEDLEAAKAAGDTEAIDRLESELSDCEENEMLVPWDTSTEMLSIAIDEMKEALQALLNAESESEVLRGIAELGDAEMHAYMEHPDSSEYMTNAVPDWINLEPLWNWESSIENILMWSYSGVLQDEWNKVERYAFVPFIQDSRPRKVSDGNIKDATSRGLKKMSNNLRSLFQDKQALKRAYEANPNGKEDINSFAAGIVSGITLLAEAADAIEISERNLEIGEINVDEALRILGGDIEGYTDIAKLVY